jgi:HEAT repeat protein
MLRLEELGWTTRAEVCAQLAEFLLDTRPASGSRGRPRSSDEPNRSRVLRLFGHLADDSSVPVLRQILWNRREKRSARFQALEALTRLRARLPLEELQKLLESPFVRSLWDTDPVAVDADVSAGEVLTMFRSEEAEQFARSAIDGWSPRERALLLLDVNDLDGEGVAAEWADWLYHRWLREDRPRLQNARRYGLSLNLLVTFETQTRPESRALLIERWRRSRGDRRQRCLSSLCGHDDEGVPLECLGDDPRELRELAEALVLRPVDLRTYYGSDSLLQVIEEQIRAIDREPWLEGYPSPRSWSVGFHRLMNLLRTWPEDEIESRLCSLFLCPNLEPDTRERLFRVLWERYRARVGPLVHAAAQDLGAPALARTHHDLERMATEPCPADREFLRWAAEQDPEPWPALRYLAVQALEALGERSDGWQQRLLELSRDVNPFVRLQAMAALVRRGDERYSPQIVRDAVEAKAVCVRAEALWILGELDAKQHFDLLRTALLNDHEEFTRCDAVAAQEAALALVRLGTPEVMTALIRSFLVAPISVASEVYWYLRPLAAHLEGGAPPIVMRGNRVWRHERRRRWNEWNS